MKCKYCNNPVPADIVAYKVCGDCFNGIESAWSCHRVAAVREGNEWATIASRENRKNGSLQYNG